MGDSSTVISAASAGTLDGLFRERVKRTPDLVAYRHYNELHQNWRDYTWTHMERQVARWQAAFEREGLAAGDRVAVMLRNCPEWAMFDIAAIGLGLVTVPLYTQDRAENIAYILKNSGSRILLFETQEQWRNLKNVRTEFSSVVRLLSLKELAPEPDEPRLVSVASWLPDEGGAARYRGTDAHAVATVVYTSGTTGRPKGVMLSHHNVLSNAYASIEAVNGVFEQDLFLSFLPLSHTFERTCGYYLSMMAGATVAYARSIQQLGEDLQTIRPTVLISVPRIYERVWAAIRKRLNEGPAFKRKLFELTIDVGYARFEYQQRRATWRPALLFWPLLRRLVADKVIARFGGRMRVALSGGAALAPEISRVFLGLGLPLLQGYGLTEASPVVCANRLDDNVPASVGTAIPGVELKIADNGALLVRGPNIMLGYWGDPVATEAVLRTDGWLDSGDLVRTDEKGRVYITGRIKDILVLSNGEKIAPSDMEASILRDPLFEHVVLVGEGRAYLTVIAVLNEEQWHVFSSAAHDREGNAPKLGSKAAERLVLKRIAALLKEFPGYLQVRRAMLTLEPWTVENGLLTPTLKLRRLSVMQKFDAEIDRMYADIP